MTFVVVAFVFVSFVMGLFTVSVLFGLDQYGFWVLSGGCVACWWNSDLTKCGSFLLMTKVDSQFSRSPTSWAFWVCLLGLFVGSFIVIWTTPKRIVLFLSDFQRQAKGCASNIKRHTRMGLSIFCVLLGLLSS